MSNSISDLCCVPGDTGEYFEPDVSQQDLACKWFFLLLMYYFPEQKCNTTITK